MVPSDVEHPLAWFDCYLLGEAAPEDPVAHRKARNRIKAAIEGANLERGDEGSAIR